jgi:hypothetical protein
MASPALVRLVSDKYRVSMKVICTKSVMLRMSSVSIFGAAALIAAFGSTRLSAVDPPSTSASTRPSVIRWGQAVAGCSLGFCPMNEAYEGGAAVDMMVIVRNEGAGKLVYNREVDWNYSPFDVKAFDCNDRPMPLTSFGTERPTDNGYRVKEICVGSQLETMIRINRVVDISCAGKYSVSVEFQGTMCDGEKRLPVKLASATLPLEIKD